MGKKCNPNTIKISSNNLESNRKKETFRNQKSPIAHWSMLSREENPPSRSSESLSTADGSSASNVVSRSLSSFPVAQKIPPSAVLLAFSSAAAAARAGKRRRRRKTKATVRAQQQEPLPMKESRRMRFFSIFFRADRARGVEKNPKRANEDKRSIE